MTEKELLNRLNVMAGRVNINNKDMLICLIRSLAAKCKQSNNAAGCRRLPWSRLCALLMLLAAFTAGARTYNVYTPKDDATVTAAFNVVVRDPGDLGSMPGTLEISASSSFSKISFRTNVWCSDSQWWVASVPAGILDCGLTTGALVTRQNRCTPS